MYGSGNTLIPQEVQTDYDALSLLGCPSAGIALREEAIKGGIMKERGRQGEEHRGMVTCTMMQYAYQIVKLTSADVFYYRTRRPQAGQSHILFKRIDKEGLEDLVKRWHKTAFPGFFGSSELRKVCSTVYENIEDKVDSPNNDYIYITNDLLYDAINKRLVRPSSDLDPNRPIPLVFRRLFDSDRVSGDQVRVPELNPTQQTLLMDEYERVYKELCDGIHSQDITEINEWACNENDIYRDILHMYSTAFMRDKPLGVFFPVGVGRNGKSACNDLWASLVGTNNCARVPLDKLGEKHYVSALRNAMINIPDETNESIVKDQAAFRTVAAHSEYQVERMGSNEPITLICDFAMACPSNHIPKWTGDSAEACVKRTMAIPFNADFSSSDSSARSWGQEHFTSDFMARLAGHVLAYASYYAEHPWEETATMTLERQGIEEDTASQYAYERLWQQMFDGYEHFTTVKKDYEKWCEQKGVRVGEMSSSDVFWRRFKRSKATNPINKREANVYRFRKQGDPVKMVMFDDLRSRHGLMNNMRLDEYVEYGSLVFALEEAEFVASDAAKRVKQMKFGL